MIMAHINNVSNSQDKNTGNHLTNSYITTWPQGSAFSLVKTDLPTRVPIKNFLLDKQSSARMDSQISFELLSIIQHENRPTSKKIPYLQCVFYCKEPILSRKHL